MSNPVGLDRSSIQNPGSVQSPPAASHPITSQPQTPSDTTHLSPNVVPQPGHYGSQPANLPWSTHDPRAASTESIAPVDEKGDKRVLLLVYIHGSLGGETSFQSFPAHIHNAVTPLLRQTHVVHTKIYPKYRSRRHIQFARDNFSEWLIPHEGKDVDVILCGHSMGGLLSAEVALLPPPAPEDPRPFKHRILGTINFDVPFLGLHPGVVVSGIGSLFRPAPKSPTAQSTDPVQSNLQAAGITSESNLSLSEPPSNDPNYNPPFPNDINLPVRKGWESALHFLQKHSDGLTRATKSYVKSHLEFGGAVTDQVALRARYRAVRALEDVKISEEQDVFRAPRRVRFVNYYTASTGIRKKSPVRSTEAGKSPSPSESPSQGLYTESTLSASRSINSSPRISVEEPRVAADSKSPQENLKEIHGNPMQASSKADSPLPLESKPDRKNSSLLDPHEKREKIAKDADAAPSDFDKPSDKSSYVPYPPGLSSTKGSKESRPSSRASSQSTAADTLSQIPPRPEPESEPQIFAEPDPSAENAPSEGKDPEIPGLPGLPTLPEPPSSFDPTAYADKDARKIAEREHDRQVKAHARAIKDREQAIKERRKMLEKRERESRKKQQKEDEAQAKKAKDEAKRLQKEEEAAYKQWRQELKEIERKRKAQEKKSIEEAKAQQAEVGRASEEAGSVKPVDVSSTGQEDTARPSPLNLEGNADSPREAEKQGRDHRFCLMPSKDSHGRRDSAWVRVFMRDVDEVIAHCGLFDAWREHYEHFISEVGDLIKQWVEHDAKTRDAESRQHIGEDSSTWTRRDDDGTERGVLETE